MPDRRPHLDRLAIILVVGCCVLWGLNQVAVKAVLHEVPPLVQAAVRSLAGAVLVIAWARARGIPLWRGDGTLPGGLAAGLLFGAEFTKVYARRFGARVTHFAPVLVSLHDRAGTLVAAAGRSSTPEARRALAELCSNYWYPLYAYLRRRGYPADQAQDLTLPEGELDVLARDRRSRLLVPGGDDAAVDDRAAAGEGGETCPGVAGRTRCRRCRRPGRAAGPEPGPGNGAARASSEEPREQPCSQ